MSIYLGVVALPALFIAILVAALYGVLRLHIATHKRTLLGALKRNGAKEPALADLDLDAITDVRLVDAGMNCLFFFGPDRKAVIARIETGAHGPVLSGIRRASLEETQRWPAV